MVVSCQPVRWQMIDSYLFDPSSALTAFFELPNWAKVVDRLRGPFEGRLRLRESQERVDKMGESRFLLGGFRRIGSATVSSSWIV